MCGDWFGKCWMRLGGMEGNGGALMDRGGLDFVGMAGNEGPV